MLPNPPLLAAALGSALATVRGDYCGAVAQYSAALTLEPTKPGVHYALAVVLGPRLGRWAEARDAMGSAVAMGHPGAADLLPFCDEQMRIQRETGTVGASAAQQVAAVVCN